MQSFVIANFTEWNKVPQAIKTHASVAGFTQQFTIFLSRLDHPTPLSFSPLWAANVETDSFFLLDFPLLTLAPQMMPASHYYYYKY